MVQGLPLNRGDLKGTQYSSWFPDCLEKISLMTFSIFLLQSAFSSFSYAFSTWLKPAFAFSLTMASESFVNSLWDVVRELWFQLFNFVERNNLLWRIYRYLILYLLRYLNFRWRMFRDFEAIQRLTQQIQGRTLHRRGLSGLGGRFCDIHVRCPDILYGTEKFPAEYCQLLGSELSSLDVKLYQDYILTLFNTVENADVVGAGNAVAPGQIFLAVPSIDDRLFTVLKTEMLSVIYGNLMSEFFRSFLLTFLSPSWI